MSKLTPQSKDFSAWYLDVIKYAELADYSKIKGCMIIKPYGYEMWEFIQGELNSRIKKAGVKNCYFPLFIPESFLKKEKDHVEGFSPECAVVTHAGGKKLAENLYIRPTSETIMYDTFSDWVQSYRDLPLKINQWANIVRWEMRTRPFLRTTEFLWQEGHTAHATEKEADEEAMRALKMYDDFDKEFLALPVITGKKSRKETFAGALYTLTTEALAKDGKAIQAGTSHQLGQTFAKAFNITFQNKEGKNDLVWQTSWGLSTRIIGTMIVVHGDDKGLKLPPKVAPIQIVIIPIFKNDEEKKLVMDFVEKINEEIKDKFRIYLDSREEVSAGYKFNEWEIKGVPIRLEIGPRDVNNGKITLVRRDTLEKNAISANNIKDTIEKLLEDIQKNLYNQALNFQKERTTEVENFEEFKKILEENPGFLKTDWCGNEKCEIKVQDETKATIRVVLEEKSKRNCFCCGQKAEKRALFAKAY